VDTPETTTAPADTRVEGLPGTGEVSRLVASLLDGMRERKRVSLARAISHVENERPGFQQLLDRLLRESPARAARVGITGPPGAGKSSLVTEFARLCRRSGEEVGVVAVDPTSPYSGGALLGDRIRMNELATDPGIFIRSMASRGSLGGLATTTKEVIDLMDTYGFPRILIETVGVGQTELEITGAADTVVVVLVPESGNGIQAMKAGLMEIADIFVVNKADRPGADRLVREIRSSLKFRSGAVPGAPGGHHGAAVDQVGHHGSAMNQAGHHGSAASAPADGDGASQVDDTDRWVPPVLLTTAQTGEGVEELIEIVGRHREWMERSGELLRRRRERVLARVRDVMDREAKRRVRRVLASEERVRDLIDRIERQEATPYSEAAILLRDLHFDG
jgi:LAO/AO transport system kinase